MVLCKTSKYFGFEFGFKISERVGGRNRTEQNVLVPKLQWEERHIPWIMSEWVQPIGILYWRGTRRVREKILLSFLSDFFSLVKSKAPNFFPFDLSCFAGCASVDPRPFLCRAPPEGGEVSSSNVTVETLHEVANSYFGTTLSCALLHLFCVARHLVDWLEIQVSAFSFTH